MSRKVFNTSHPVSDGVYLCLLCTMTADTTTFEEVQLAIHNGEWYSMQGELFTGDIRGWIHCSKDNTQEELVSRIADISQISRECRAEEIDNHYLGELIAVILRDGGQRLDEVGLACAVKECIAKIHSDRTAREWEKHRITTLEGLLTSHRVFLRSLTELLEGNGFDAVCHDAFDMIETLRMYGIKEPV